MTEPEASNRISPYPPFVTTGEQKRRWRIVTIAALMNYGFELGSQLDRSDRALIWQTQRTFFASDLDTGDGDVTADQRLWLESLQLL
jgi:hypothetical protein